MMKDFEVSQLKDLCRMRIVLCSGYRTCWGLCAGNFRVVCDMVEVEFCCPLMEQ